MFWQRLQVLPTDAHGRESVCNSVVDVDRELNCPQLGPSLCSSSLEGVEKLLSYSSGTHRHGQRIATSEDVDKPLLGFPD